MKIAFIGNQLRAMARFWQSLLARMQDLGHCPLVLAPHEEGEASGRARDLFRSMGIEVFSYPLSRKGLNPLEDAGSFFALRSLLAHLGPEICFASTIKPVIWGLLAARACGIRRRYAAITGLGYAFEGDTGPKRAIGALVTRLYRQALAGVSGVFFQNPDDCALFRWRRIISPDTPVYLTRGVGVDLARFTPQPLPALPPEGPLIFLMVARLLLAKGLAEYARAGELLAGRPCRLLLLGPAETGPGAARPADIADWQERGFLRWLGESEDVREHLASCHCLVLPSYREGTPTAIMEGMATGRPAIVSDAPGCRDLVREGRNGFLVPVGDAYALAEAMGRFLDRPGLVAQMGASAREMAERELGADAVAAEMALNMGLEAQPRDGRQ